MLDRGRPSDALTLLTGETRGQSGWYGPLLAQWRAALRARLVPSAVGVQD